MPETVEVLRRELVAEVRFASPPFNYASPGLIGAIAEALLALDDDPAVRCTVLSSAGDVFCAGANLAAPELDADRGVDRIAALYRRAERLFARRKPMVAAIQGAAVGAGLGLALAADFRVAAPRARFSANFVALGFHPGFALTHTLPRLLGLQRASRMLLTAERVKAATALEWGLVDALAEDGDALAGAHQLAASIAANAPLSLQSVRAALSPGQHAEVAAAMRRELERQAELRRTADYREGVAAVFERRPACFTGS